MEFSAREKQIIKLVQKYEPMTGDAIAHALAISKSTLRTELALLVKLGILISKTNVGYCYNNAFEENIRYDELKLAKVEEVMGVAVTALSTDTFTEVIAKLFLHDVGTVFIVDGENYLAGVVSRKDLLKIMIANHNAQHLPIAMAMTRMPNVIYTTPEDSILDPLRKITSHEIDCIPVVSMENDKYKIIGKVSKTTIIRLFLDVLEK